MSDALSPRLSPSFPMSPPSPSSPPSPVSRPRRAWLRAAVATGLGLAGGVRAQGAAPGVLFGFPRGSQATTLMDTLLPLLRGRYQPDLGSTMRYLPGNASRLAIDALRRGPADGSQWLLSPSSMMTLLPHLQQVPGDTVLRDLVPVAPLAEFSFALTISSAVPAAVQSMADYLAWLREHPGKAGYGLPGLGSGPHLVGMALAARTELPLKPVVYQGTAPLVKDLLAGAVPAGLTIIGAGAEGLADGRLRALMVTSDQRWPTLPAVPTARELGLVDLPLVESYGFYARSGTPAAKLAEFNAALQPVLRAAAMAALVSGQGLRLPQAATPEQFLAELLADSERWRAAVKAHSFSLRG